MHPAFGWTPFFRFFTIALAFSVPANIILNIASLSALLFSYDDANRASVATSFLRFGALYNMFLVIYPLLVLFAASWFPGPRIERFGAGPLRVKLAILVAVPTLLAVGAAIRLAYDFNPVGPGTEEDHVLYRKSTFYTTQFTIEILVVALLAVTRVDLRFHVPDGAAGPGDYSAPPPVFDANGELIPAPVSTRNRAQIAAAIDDLGVPYEILRPRPGTRATSAGRDEPLVAMFFADADEAVSSGRMQRGRAKASASGNTDSTPGDSSTSTTTSRSSSSGEKLPTVVSQRAASSFHQEFYRHSARTPATVHAVHARDSSSSGRETEDEDEAADGRSDMLRALQLEREMSRRGGDAPVVQTVGARRTAPRRVSRRASLIEAVNAITGGGTGMVGSSASRPNSGIVSRSSSRPTSTWRRSGLGTGPGWTNLTNWFRETAEMEGMRESLA